MASSAKLGVLSFLIIATLGLGACQSTEQPKVASGGHIATFAVLDLTRPYTGPETKGLVMELKNSAFPEEDIAQLDLGLLVALKGTGQNQVPIFKYKAKYCDPGEATSSQNRCKEDNLNRLNAVRKNFIKEAVTTFKAQPPATQTTSSDLWATLPRAATFFTEHPEDSTRRLIYCSDMEHHIKGERLFSVDKNLPPDEPTARQWATEDVQKIKERYTLQESFLKGVEVTVIFPPNPMSTERGRQEMTWYWTALFEAFGTQNIHFK